MNSYNATVSENSQKRERIDALRKERTLLDQIFKELEYELVKEEEALFVLLQKNQELEDDLEEISSAGKEMVDNKNRLRSNTFRKVMDEGKNAYAKLAVEAKRQREKNHSVSN